MITLYSLRDNLTSPDHVYAHTKYLPCGDGEKELVYETLHEHVGLSVNYYYKIAREKNLHLVICNFLSTFNLISDDAQNYFQELFLNAIYMHDMGKANVSFQINKMNSPHYIGREIEGDTEHSLMSGVIFLDHYIPKIIQAPLSLDEKKCLLCICLVNAYAISRHHGGLFSVGDFIDKACDWLLQYQENVYPHRTELFKHALWLTPSALRQRYESCLKGLAVDTIDIKYLAWTKYVHSCIVACDNYATTEYSNDFAFETFGTIADKDYWEQVYIKNGTYQAILRYMDAPEKPNLDTVSDINTLRTALFLESREALSSVEDTTHIYYLEAPTGSGKTNTSIRLALDLLQRYTPLNKLFYIFPFNALAEQTRNSLLNYFSADPELFKSISIVNSVNAIPLENDDIPLEYTKAFLGDAFLHYPCTLTSHVHLFGSLFSGYGKFSAQFYQLANSVIILDEPQSYRNSIWEEIISSLEQYASLLNLKIIIMSATLPRLDKLIDYPCNMATLIRDKHRYFNHRLFKERVSLDFSLLALGDPLPVITEGVIEASQDTTVSSRKILIEFITKGSATSYYHHLKQHPDLKDKTIFLITGDDSKIEREKILRQVNALTDVILVATQCVEAGVDIDMDIGYKNMSLLDSEEQFLGRINRSCLRTGKAYFFCLDKTSLIYQSDVRANREFTLLGDLAPSVLYTKDFTGFYSAVMSVLKEQNKGSVGEYIQALNVLDFSGIGRHMQLISNELYPIQVFLPFEIEDMEGNLIQGEQVWHAYQDIASTHFSYSSGEPYGKREVLMSQLRPLFDCFVFQVKDCELVADDVLGDIYYVKDGARFLVDNKFDRELFHTVFPKRRG